MKKSQDLYEAFIECQKRKKITYDYLAEALGTSAGAIHDKIKRLKEGKSVYSSFLLNLEEVMGESIFFK
ncbi:hypothetical protein [Fusobacterium ulcerans]|uniref:hypothetical protein n=1 Tax=Fusobacterium ulcerans TaxID=861 RepID=UPI0030976DBC